MASGSVWIVSVEGDLDLSAHRFFTPLCLVRERACRLLRPDERVYRHRLEFQAQRIVMLSRNESSTDGSPSIVSDSVP